MKKLFFIFITTLILMLCSCESADTVSTIAQVVPTSYLTGWYVDDDMVYMVCKLIIESNDDVMVRIEAYSEEDVGGLLENGTLTGYNEDMSSTVFTLHKGRNEEIVVFVGVYGTSRNKADYEIPDKIILRDRE